MITRELITKTYEEGGLTALKDFLEKLTPYESAVGAGYFIQMVTDKVPENAPSLSKKQEELLDDLYAIIEIAYKMNHK